MESAAEAELAALLVTAREMIPHVQCYQCGKELKASSLGCHLADVHDIYQQTVIAKELLEAQPPVLYMVSAELHARDLPCLYPGCLGRLRDGWMMHQHFWDVHPMDLSRFPRTVSLIAVSDVACKCTPSTPATGARKSARLRWIVISSERRQ
jgi:hypothetical protein